MRGLLGDKLSLYGDSMYDWAKLYQSLIGYDYIHQGKKIELIDKDYHDSLIVEFIRRFVEIYDNNMEYLKHLKAVTKSLIFSMLPLHKDESIVKLLKYYDLLNSPYLS